MFQKLRSLFGVETGGQKTSEADNIAEAAAFLLVEAASMDNDFDDVERAHVRTLLINRFNLDGAAADAMIADAETLHEEAVGWYRQSRTLKDAFDYHERIGLMEMLWEVVYADGELHDMEANMMRRIAGLLYVEDRDSGHARKEAMTRLGLA